MRGENSASRGGERAHQKGTEGVSEAVMEGVRPGPEHGVKEQLDDAGVQDGSGEPDVLDDMYGGDAVEAAGEGLDDAPSSDAGEAEVLVCGRYHAAQR